MTRITQFEVEDFSKNASDSELVAVVHFHTPDRTIEVTRNGAVRFISAAGTAIAQFQEGEKQDLLRQNYIQMLIANGVRGEEFLRALAAIERVDRRLASGERGQMEGDLEQRSQAHMRRWAAEHALDYDAMDEEEWFNQIQQAVTTIRQRGRA